MAQTDTENALHALQGKLGSWTAVGRYVAAQVGGNPASWTATANAVANGKRRPPHCCWWRWGCDGRRARWDGRRVGLGKTAVSHLPKRP